MGYTEQIELLLKYIQRNSIDVAKMSLEQFDQVVKDWYLEAMKLTNAVEKTIKDNPRSFINMVKGGI